ncbi:polysaccharide lyase family 1 protein, partial [Hydnum rufescens UP504]
TTGGGSATPQIPSSNAELVSWLGDSTPRVILLDRIFDFTGTMATAQGCKPWTCSPHPQVALSGPGWSNILCLSSRPNAAKIEITYDKAGPAPIKVGSHKTLLGKGSAGGIKGKGLRIARSQNIIIQTPRTDQLNPRIVWGGDAITIDGGSNIWVDHNRIQNIGRQMLVTGYGAAKNTTFSNNMLYGVGYFATCNGRHYWVALFTGASDEITFALNYSCGECSGRGPHVGGTSGYTQKVHVYNNYYVSVQGHALDPEEGSNILAEGNYMDSVTTPILPVAGSVFYPLTSQDSASCNSVLHRACMANMAVNSGKIDVGSTAHLSAFARPAVQDAQILAASAVPAYVQANARLGVVN